MKREFVYIVTAESESGDRYGPWVFGESPTPERLESFLRKECPSEFEDGPGPGSYGSYLHVTAPQKSAIR